ncbi:MAG: HAD-IIIA family hydrolase [Crocinitomicaceae bacterium]|nr:HAD-IIIA family hydrolase [Crocinitomicaceae bacterium]
MLPKLIVTDIDGVWTDGGMYYDQSNIELKKFNTSDSAGVLWCRLNGIPVVIITGENTDIVKRRADKLKIDHVYLGVKDKVKVLDSLLVELNLEWTDVAYIGDDLNDYQVLKKVGYSSCPLNAPKYIQEIVHKVTPVKGGYGAFRAFVEQILIDNNLMETSLSKYFEQNKNDFKQ